MDIQTFINKYSNHPILFLGTGISLRYLNNSYSWDNLLKKAIYDISSNEEIYFNIKARHQKNGEYLFPEIALDVEKFFNEYLERNREGKFKTINDRFFENMKKGINISRFKIYISDLLKKLNFKPDKLDEIDALKKTRKNIGSIITTNYDNIAETIFTFSPLIGNDILLSNPYGTIYKIHGTIDNPNSIIITSKDYEIFTSKYELIRAQLLSLFIHNPIIFLGYNLGDENIKSILRTIFSYVDLDSQIAETIRDNFLIVEYKKDVNDSIVSEFDIAMNDSTIIKVNKVKTDNFLKIYNALSDLQLPISAMDIRKVQSIVGDIYAGTKGIKVYITEDINSLHNNDKVLAIGSNKTITYQYQTQKELLIDYFKIIEESNSQRISLIDKYSIPSSQYFPIYGFLNINKDLHTAEKLKENENKKICELKKKVEEKIIIHNNHTSIKEIMSDDTISISNKNLAIAYSVLKRQIKLDLLETYLKKYNKEYSTNYNRLLVLYDYMKYK